MNKIKTKRTIGHVLLILIALSFTFAMAYSFAQNSHITESIFLDMIIFAMLIIGSFGLLIGVVYLFVWLFDD